MSQRTEMFEKSFLTFPDKTETIRVKRRQEDSFMFLQQQQLIHNQNKTAPALILTLAFEPPTWAVFMAQ